MQPLSSPPHPGQYFHDKFLLRGKATLTELASAMSVSSTVALEFSHGLLDVDYPKAVALGRYTKTSPTFWLALQRDYDEHIAEFVKQVESFKPANIAPLNSVA
ncbi:helix-turn-helix transcriptional regulator [Alteromonas sp. ASW11-130]|uniref:helix-turn-helix transcriptional regulator n=1 Tax=Alteromonas sp. ASW11-130 TaxID=3015775 RepID=UPI002242B3D1|nr:hypothetical protein [Alteromonas sp. ASW11-130]MCW8092088.1 hypothetical protein [Alteromonas sp. ASW11-130]